MVLVVLFLMGSLLPAPRANGANWANATHPFHVSIAEVEYNSKSKKLEIALKVWPNDLEKAVEIQNKRRVNIEKDPKADELILKYLESAFQVTDIKKKPGKLNWVGKEIGIKEAWLYFEVSLENGVDGAVFENKICFEVLDDQVNTVLFRKDKKRLSLKTTRNQPKQTLSFKNLK